MGHMDALRAQLARHALGQGPQRMLGARKGRKARRTAQGCRGAGEQDGAAPASHHAPRRGLRVQKAAEAGHLPDLEVLAGRLIEHAARHVGADVEHQHLDGPVLSLDALEQGLHLVLLAGIAGIAMRLATFGTDAVHQGPQLVGTAARDTADVALAGKAPRNGAASGVARPDHQGHAAWLLCLRHTRVSIDEGVRWCPPGR